MLDDDDLDKIGGEEDEPVIEEDGVDEPDVGDVVVHHDGAVPDWTETQTLNRADVLGYGSDADADVVDPGPAIEKVLSSIEESLGVQIPVDVEMSREEKPVITFIPLEEVDETIDMIAEWVEEDIPGFVQFLYRDLLDGTHDDVRKHIGEWMMASEEELRELFRSRALPRCRVTLKKAALKRDEMKFKKYDKLLLDDCTSFIYEALLTLYFHRRHKRDDGSYYWEEHCMGTVDNLIEDGFTGFVRRTVALKHDDDEDTEARSDDLMCAEEVYLHRLEDKNLKKIRKAKSRVQKGVKGVTKVETVGKHLIGMERKLAIAEATDERFLRELVEEVTVALVKISDRTHNMATLEAKEHVKPGSAMLKARDVEQKQLIWAKILGLRDKVRRLTYSCVQQLNPEFHEKFYSERNKRCGEFEPVMERAEAILTEIGYEIPVVEKNEKGVNVTKYEIGCVGKDDVEVVPLGIDYYTRLEMRSFADMQFEGLGINKSDPMQEILVLVDGQDSIGQVINTIVDKFDLRPTKSMTKQNLGRVFRGFSRKLDAQLLFRVNDRVAEARSYRGIFADSLKRDVPPYINGVARSILARKDAGLITGVTDAMREELLRTRIKFATPPPGAREWGLPAGSTYIDAAARVHGDFLIGMNKAHVSSDLSSGRSWAVSPLDDMNIDEGSEHIPVIEFETLFEEGNVPMLSELRINPAWSLLCRTDRARKIIRKFLKAPNAYLESKKPSTHSSPVSVEVERTTLINIGGNYFNNLVALYNLDKASFMTLLATQLQSDFDAEDLDDWAYDSFSKAVEEEDVFIALARCDLNPLRVLTDLVEKSRKHDDRKTWSIEVPLANEPGTMEHFVREFRRRGFSLRNMKSKKDGDDFDNVKFTVTKPGKDSVIDTYAFFRTLLKLRQDFGIKLIGRSPIS